MRNKEYYEERFKDYPDLVNLEQFREMPVSYTHLAASIKRYSLAITMYRGVGHTKSRKNRTVSGLCIIFAYATSYSSETNVIVPCEREAMRA